MTIHELNPVDPFDLLVSMRSTDIDQPVQPGDDPGADTLLASILAGNANHDPDRRRRWRRRAIGGAIAVAVASGGAVAASRLLAEPTDSASLSCYSNASTEPDIQAALLIDPSTTPEQQCAPLWSDGPLGSDGPPRLASCVTDTGITAVIPGTGDTCVEIGYHERAPSEPGERNVAAEITNSISDTWTEEDRCIREPDEARALVDQIFDDLDVTGWTIDVAHSPSDELPCIGAGVDAERSAVFFIAYPDVE
jgi:hypothetical protein